MYAYAFGRMGGTAGCRMLSNLGVRAAVLEFNLKGKNERVEKVLLLCHWALFPFTHFFLLPMSNYNYSYIIKVSTHPLLKEMTYGPGNTTVVYYHWRYR